MRQPSSQSRLSRKKKWPRAMVSLKPRSDTALYPPSIVRTVPKQERLYGSLFEKSKVAKKPIQEVIKPEPKLEFPVAHPFQESPFEKKKVSQSYVEAPEPSINSIVFPQTAEKAPVNSVASTSSRIKTSETRSGGETSALKQPHPELKKDIYLSPKEASADIPKEKQPTGLGIRKIIVSLAAILFIIVLGSAGYYLWFTRQGSPKKDEAATNKPIQPTSPTLPIEITPPGTTPTTETSKFNLDKPNYLQVDLSNTAPDDVKNSVIKYIEEIKKENIAGPLEFMVTDKENNPVSFKTFAGKMGIALSSNLTDALEDNFALFIYGDNGNYRIGLAIDYRTTSDIRKLLLAEEPRLTLELKSLFLDTLYTEPKSLLFSSGNYKNYLTRYLNIISPRELSLDYTVLDQKLVVGTTMLDQPGYHRLCVEAIGKLHGSC